MFFDAPVNGESLQQNLVYSDGQDLTSAGAAGRNAGGRRLQNEGSAVVQFRQSANLDPSSRVFMGVIFTVRPRIPIVLPTDVPTQTITALSIKHPSGTHVVNLDSDIVLSPTLGNMGLWITDNGDDTGEAFIAYQFLTTAESTVIKSSLSYRLATQDPARKQ